MGLEAWANGFAHGFHRLGFDRQHDHIGVLDGLGVVGEYFDAVLGVHTGAGVGARIAGADLRSVQTLGAQAADQAGGHVAGTDKGNTNVAHVRSL
ncbi:hypothetical protein D3C87_1720520 [compost metagenome]